MFWYRALTVFLIVGASSQPAASQVNATENPSDEYYGIHSPLTSSVRLPVSDSTASSPVLTVNAGRERSTLEGVQSSQASTAGNTFWPNLLSIVVGGTLTIAGSVVAAKLRAKYAHDAKFDEVVAERKVAVYEEAYWRMKNIASPSSMAKYEAAERKLRSYEEWFWKSRLYLPMEFCDAWIDLRWTLLRLCRRANYGELKEGEMLQSESQADQLIAEALRAVIAASKSGKLEPGRSVARLQRGGDQLN